MEKNPAASAASPADLITQRIAELGDWRGKLLARLRQLILEADPQITEDWKWRGVPVWYRDGMLCTGETYKSVVKMTFAKGAALQDPARLFNASLDGNVRRAIDFHETDTLDEAALKDLVREAVAANTAGKASKKPAKPAEPVLLAGGNPQIAKADGDAPVQAYIAAMPGWKRDVGRRLDALIVRAVPGVCKAIKWNSPFYGIEGQGWFLGFHCLTRYVKVAFFEGASLQPLPPGTSKQKDVRYLDVHEHDVLDEAQFMAWVQQASRLPGQWPGTTSARSRPRAAPKTPAPSP